jgi:hypothetical protein
LFVHFAEQKASLLSFAKLAFFVQNEKNKFEKIFCLCFAK